MPRRLIAAALVAALAAGTPALLRAEGMGSAIRQVISDQISAFLADDFETAFTFASPNIKRLFRDPDRFGRMVRDGYPMVWRPSDVRFAALLREGDRMVQSVFVTDERGALHVLDYDMIETERGWEIDGVRVRRPNDAGA
jgi:hypothetical protein